VTRPAKCLGIDPGDARIGVATSDDLGITARPLETIDRRVCRDALARVRDLAISSGAGTVVIGLPLHMDGSEGKAAAKARAFGDTLRALLPPEISIEMTDERLSTTQATRHLRNAGKKTRQVRSLVDQTAATLILQDYLDQRDGPSSSLLPADCPQFPP
jgi:putative Holliday junction resolvase